MRVNYCYVRVPHFMAHSGYELVAAQGERSALGSDVSIAGQGKRWPRHRVLRYPQMVIRKISRLEEYSFAAAALEARTAGRLIRSRGEVYHFLYGEHFCRFVPYLNGWRDNSVIATFHQTAWQLEQQLHTTAHLKSLEAAVILGNNQRAFFQQFLPAEKVWLVPHGVDTSYFVPLRHRPEHDEPLCVCIGGHLRDFDSLARAMQIIQEREYRFRYEVVARRGQAAAVQGLRGVRVRDYVSDQEMLRLYQEADVIILPYNDVVASNVLLESMACGAAIVVTDVGAVGDYLDATMAELVELRDAEALAEGIIVLATDPQRRTRLGERARQRAESLDHGAMAKELAKMYDTLESR